MTTNPGECEGARHWDWKSYKNGPRDTEEPEAHQAGRVQCLGGRGGVRGTQNKKALSMVDRVLPSPKRDCTGTDQISARETEMLVILLNL